MEKYFSLLTASLLLFFAASATPLNAEMYKWVDTTGAMHVTDNLFNVPQEYLSQVKTLEVFKGPTEDGDIPLTKSPMGFILEARLNGVEDIRLLLDTGATATVISPKVLIRAGAALPREKTIVVHTAGGDVRAARVEIASLAVGWAKQGPLNVVAHEAVGDCDGLLGMDFLSAYHFEILTYGPKLRLGRP